MFGLFKRKAAPVGPNRSVLIPRIRTCEFLKALQRRNIPTDHAPYTEPLAADLLVTFAFDLPGTYLMASNADIRQLGVPVAEVRALAVANLKRQIPTIKFVQHGPVCRIVTPVENMEACTLLDRTFWEQIARDTGGEVVASAPSRDVVLFCDGGSVEDIAALRRSAAEALMNAARNALSDRLLVWRGGSWIENAR